jgi:hypothetical protein
VSDGKCLKKDNRAFEKFRSVVITAFAHVLIFEATKFGKSTGRRNISKRTAASVIPVNFNVCINIFLPGMLAHEKYFEPQFKVINKGKNRVTVK